jgi:fimbrial isopeptide formation D2 family protein/uncharacterized repeat protein (TIGR01451 family)
VSSAVAPTFFSRLITGRAGRITATVLVMLLAAVTLVAGPGLDSAQADSLLSLTASDTASVLAAGNSTVTMTATNSSTTNLYNLAFEYTLPAGANYVAGSTTPVLAGDPQIVTITDQTVPVLITHQVLVWNNVEDLPATDVETLTFTYNATAASFPVGAPVNGNGAIYANTDARQLVAFTAGSASNFTNNATASPTATTITALSISKTEPSPENELMRGVHDHPTTYSIVVKNTTVAATNAVTVIDYIPAALEFLGCGGVDYTTVYESTDHRSLANTPAPAGGCTPPSSVNTVNNPAAGYSGVYTVVTWNLGNMAAGASETINYEAAIPLRANALFTTGGPSAASLHQASNLDNNTGALTRQNGAASVITNTAVASGTYTGALYPGTPAAVNAQATAQVKAMDLSVVKTVSPTTFSAGSVATYDLRVRTSEYTNLSGVTLTDVIPNGLCPELPAGTPIVGSLPIPSDCQTTGTVTNATVVSEQSNSDGTFTVIFVPTQATTANSDFHITYPALMRANYAGSVNAPTAAGDSFTNVVNIVGTSTDTTAVDPTGTQPQNTVTDDSRSTITSSAPTIDKEVLPRTNVPGGASDCSTYSTQYVEDSKTIPAPVFQLGDYVCFKLTVNFSASAETRNAQVQDFVPTGTTFNDWAYGTESTVPASEVAFSSPTNGLPTWNVGATAGAGSDLFVAKGQQLVLYVSALITAPSATNATTLTGNLMKYSQVNTNNTLLALRDQAGFSVAPAGTMSLSKGITTVNGAAVTGAPAASATASETNVVAFSLTATNTGTAALGNNFPTNNVAVWDYLPTPLTCASVTQPIPASGTCTDNFSGSRSRILWTIAAPVAAGASAPSLTYSVTLPRGVSVSTALVNNASIASFGSPNTTGANTTYYPINSLDTADTANWNTTAANASATINAPNASVVKTAVVVDPSNPTPGAKVVAGDTINYSYNTSVPGNTTVYNGVLTDTLPITLGNPVTVSADVPEQSGITTTTAPNFGYTLAVVAATSTSGAKITLTFPATEDNVSAAAETFTVHLTGVPVLSQSMSGAAINITAGSTIVNTAAFNSKTAVTGGTSVTQRTGSATVTVGVPHPTIIKTSSATTATAGQIITYTLAANNTTAGSTVPPTGYDSVVIDCLPAGLTWQAFGTLPSGVTTSGPTAGTGPAPAGNGCATNTTLLSWTIGNLLASTSPTTGVNAYTNNQVLLTYTAMVDPNAAGLVNYLNTAALTTSTISDGKLDKTEEGVLSATTSLTTTVAGAAMTKTFGVTNATTGPLTVGDSTQYTVTAVIPADVNFFQAALIDTVPAGLTIGTATVTCVTAELPAQDCTPDFAGGAAQTLTPSGSKIGWYLGDLTSTSYARTVTVTYTGTVRDIAGNVHGTTLPNSATLSWNATNTGAPAANAGSTFDESDPPVTATVTVTEPSLSITKTVSNPTPNPGDSLTYTLTAANANTATTSTAYNVTVTDAVPTGIVVGTINNGGTIAGADATTGGGTITWALPASIPVGGSTQLSYTATLAPSANLTAAALVNTASIPTYASLPSGGRTYTTSPPTATATVTPQFPNVTVSKAATGGALAYIGSVYPWTITYTNTGDGIAKTITPTDILPPNWLYKANTAFVVINGGTSQQVEPSTSLSAGQETLLWQGFGPVPAGASVVITYDAIPQAGVTTSPGVGDTVPHVNTATGITTDNTNATHNQSGAFTGAQAQAQTAIDKADVEIVKTAGSALIAGTNVADAWHLTVSNAGTDTAIGPFTITDQPGTLPAGIVIQSAAGSGWSCTTPTSTGMFRCTRSDPLTSGSSFPVVNVDVTVAAATAAGTTVDNTAGITDSTYDPDLSNNSSSQQLTVVADADLKVVKTMTGAAAAGQTATWNIAVQNLGPSISAAPVTVTDTLPNGLTNVSADGGASWTCGPITATVTCTYVGSLAVTTAPGITVTGLIPSSATGNIANTAVVSGTTTDLVAGNNTSTVTTPISTSTTLAIQKTLLTSPFVPGAPATYQFDVTNQGQADARSITVVDALPSGLTYAQSSTSVTPGWTCSGSSTAPSTVTCNLTGTLAPATTATVRIVVNVPSSITSTVTNTATASAANAPSVSDHTDGAPVGSSDLTITKTHPPGSVFAGSDVTYTIAAGNAGPSDTAGPIVIVDTLPAHESFVSATGTGWSCSFTAPNVTCSTTSGIVVGGSSTSITLVALVDPATGTTTITNSATVSGPNTDPHPNNNTANDPTNITTSAAVTISKSGSATIVAGADTSYTITVSNVGPSDATAVSVLDSLPTGIAPVSITSSDFACTLATFTCTVADLPPGTSTITVTGHVASDQANGTTLTNSATVTSHDTSGTNTATATKGGLVSAIADLALTKTAASANANAGTQTSFSFSLNNSAGPSDAVGPITITDTLPTGMSYVGSTGTQWTCVPDGANPQVVVCTLDGNAGLAFGQTAPGLSMLVSLDSGLAAGPLTNSAVAATVTAETNLANNASSATIIIGGSADLKIEKTLDSAVRIGDTTSFSLAVTNLGPSDADSVTVTDVMPPGLTDVDISTVALPWTCVVEAPTSAGTPVNCSLAGTLVPGAAPALVISGTVGASLYPSFVNTATVASTTLDPDTANNTSSLTVIVPPQVDLSVTKTHTGQLVSGKNVAYLITVTNSGTTPQPAGYTITDPLPAGLGFVSSAGTGVACVESGSLVTCVFTSALAIGASSSVTLTTHVTASAPSTIINTATAGTSAEQLTTANVTAYDPGTVAPAARVLSSTGVAILGNLFAGLMLLLLGLLFVGVAFVWTRLRRPPGRA